MKKKIINTFEIILIIGAFVLSFFTKKKMGMSRHVQFINYKYGFLKYMPIASGIALVLAIIFLIINIKNKKFKLGEDFFSLIIILFSGVSIAFGEKIFGSAYFLVLILTTIASILESIKLGRKID